MVRNGMAFRLNQSEDLSRAGLLLINMLPEASKHVGLCSAFYRLMKIKGEYEDSITPPYGMDGADTEVK